ncbi:hypothetical protein DL95DRAFT_411326 [Leptodontidium sp. 2 PMI_412]|nr:hypothetical protein DL95DRAFT_411326 [Leptodontidium sp. 2 PMI_412]
MAWASWSVDACTGLDGLGGNTVQNAGFHEVHEDKLHLCQPSILHPPTTCFPHDWTIEDRAMIYFWISKGAFASFYTFATSSQTPRLFLTHFITSDASEKCCTNGNTTFAHTQPQPHPHPKRTQISPTLRYEAIPVRGLVLLCHDLSLSQPLLHYCLLLSRAANARQTGPASADAPAREARRKESSNN